MRAAQIKERLTLREVAAMASIDLPKDGEKFHSPFRPDNNPSCSINGDLFTDWSSGEHLDSIGFFAAAKNISSAAAIRELRLQLSGEANRPPIIRPRKPLESPQGPVEAPDPIEASPDLIQQAAKSRGLSVEAFEHARMTLGTLSYNRIHGQKCWVLCDSKKIGWEARRCDGKPFDALGELHERKSHSKGRGLKKWPVGLVPPGIPAIRIALKKPSILLVEGAPDYIAACELVHGLPELVLPCAMLGKSASISDEALPYFQNRRVTIAGHPDARERVEFWARQIADAGAASVSPVLLGLGFDLNEHLRNHPHRIEEIRGLLGLAQIEPSNTDLGEVIPLHSGPNGKPLDLPLNESTNEDL